MAALNGSLEKMNINGDAAPSQPTPFGKAMREHFMLAKGWRNLNHSSFGVFPRSVRDAQRNLQDACEAAPDRFLRYEHAALLLEARRAVASMVHAPVSNVVLIPNASMGTNLALRNLQYKAGDKILYFNAIYPACEKTILHLEETTPVQALKVDVNYPIADDDFVALFEDAVKKERDAGNEVKVAVFDTILSMPGIRIPFEKLVKKCRELGVYSCIDGAHGIGQIPLNLGELDPDFFVTNCHKWMYTPRGCAVFYVAKKNQKLIRTTFPTSHGFVPADPARRPQMILPQPSDPDSTPFIELFDYVATVDTTPYLVIPEALRFRKEVCGGEEALMKYVADLCRKGSDYVAEQLGTDILDNKEGTHREGVAMATIRLPLDFSGPNAVKLDNEAGPYSICQWLHKTSLEYDTFFQTGWFNDSWWLRLAGQSYLDMEDFEWAAKVAKELCERIKKGEHLQ